MKLLKYLGHAMRVVTLLGYNYEYSSMWDSALRSLLENKEHTFELDNGFYHLVITHHETGDQFSVWIANKWYSYGNLSLFSSTGDTGEIQKRPSFSTMLLLEAKVEELQKEREKRVVEGV